MKQFWIRPEGISKPCHHHAAVYTEDDLKNAEKKEFILEGIHVIDMASYQLLLAEANKMRDLLESANGTVISYGMQTYSKLAYQESDRITDALTQFDKFLSEIKERECKI